jgi:ABC-type transporter Mla subunit MlaD
MATIKDVQRLTDDLERLVGELRSELDNGVDFERLAQIADEISEHADNAAETFTSVNQTLMSRIREIGGSVRSGGQKSSNQSKSRSSS